VRGEARRRGLVHRTIRKGSLVGIQLDTSAPRLGGQRGAVVADRVNRTRKRDQGRDLPCRCKRCGFGVLQTC